MWCSPPVGYYRRNNLRDFTNIKRNGKIAMKLQDGDDLLGDAVMKQMMCCWRRVVVRLSDLCGCGTGARGRDSTGVRGIKLLGNDQVVSMSVITENANQFILSVTENGYGNVHRLMIIVSLDGGQGVANIETSKRNGKVMAFAVVDDDQLMLVTNMGQVIRIRVYGGEGDSIRIASRKTQGVRLFDVKDDENEKVVSAGLVRETDEDEDAASGEGKSSGFLGDTHAPTSSDLVNEDLKGKGTNSADLTEDTAT